MKMEQTECSETSEYKLQTPGNYPEEIIQHSEHGKSLRSRNRQLYTVLCSRKINKLTLTEQIQRDEITKIYKVIINITHAFNTTLNTLSLATCFDFK